MFGIRRQSLDKEARFEKRRITTVVQQHDPAEGMTEYKLMVAGDRAELHIHRYERFEMLHNGDFIEWQDQKVVMSKTTLELLIDSAKHCIEKSELFESNNP